ncbi:unnamed protein product [Rhizophagus irregularis]|nr:unnamed protein product [Rhizophagus irregularis]
MEEGSSGLPKNGKRRTKVRLGCLEYLLKNGKNQDSFWVGFRRTENSKICLGWISGGLLNNGKELRFIWVGSKELKEGTKIRLGWVSEEWKKGQDSLYFLNMKIGKFRRITSKLFFVPEY